MQEFCTHPVQKLLHDAAELFVRPSAGQQPLHVPEASRGAVARGQCVQELLVWLAPKFSNFPPSSPPSSFNGVAACGPSSPLWRLRRCRFVALGRRTCHRGGPTGSRCVAVSIHGDRQRPLARHLTPIWASRPPCLSDHENDAVRRNPKIHLRLVGVTARTG